MFFLAGHEDHVVPFGADQCEKPNVDFNVRVKFRLGNIKVDDTQFLLVIHAGLMPSTTLLGSGKHCYVNLSELTKVPKKTNFVVVKVGRDPEHFRIFTHAYSQ